MKGQLKNTRVMKNKNTLVIVVLVFVAIITATMSFITTSSDEIITSGAKTTIEFEKTELDLGTIKQGIPKEVVFTFTNPGNAPLIIYDVETSCGCTGAEWPKKPIKANEKEEITITYDAKETGKFIKTITVYGNLDLGSKALLIKGVVE